jgi:hypothetical protein
MTLQFIRQIAAAEPSRITPVEKDEFVSRFKAELKRLLPDGAYEDAEKYVAEIAPTYWDDVDQRAYGPEECAESEASEWTDEE